MAFFVLLIFTCAYCCASTILVESNISSSCNGSLDECVIEDDLEFLVDPYLRSRMLQSSVVLVLQMILKTMSFLAGEIETQNNIMTASMGA